MPKKVLIGIVCAILLLGMLRACAAAAGVSDNSAKEEVTSEEAAYVSPFGFTKAYGGINDDRTYYYLWASNDEMDNCAFVASVRKNPEYSSWWMGATTCDDDTYTVSDPDLGDMYVTLDSIDDESATGSYTMIEDKIHAVAHDYESSKELKHRHFKMKRVDLEEFDKMLQSMIDGDDDLEIPIE